MIGFPEADTTVYESWSHVLTSLLQYQWQLLEAQMEAGRRALVQTIGFAMPPALERPGDKPAPPATGATPTADVGAEVRQLQQAALECVQRGKVPPRKIYAAPYRRQIDWTKFPDWARPSDPELFADLAHEG